MPAPRINYALAATLVTQGVSLAEAAKQVGAKNANVLGSGLRRKGVTVRVARGLEPVAEARKSITVRLATEAGQLLKTRLAGTLDRHAEALEQVPVRPDLDHIQAVGAALEPLARAGKIVHDWGNETQLGLVALGVVEHLDQAQDVIDVSSSVSETPTSGVQPESPESQTPQG